MPSYDRAHYLGAAMQSVFEQTFEDFELIVVDDGSTDGTQDLLRQVRDDRLRILGQDHQGISTAVNTGIQAAQGTYIARLDSDDVWLPEMLAILVPVLDEQPEIGFVYAKAQGMDVTGQPLGDERGSPIPYARNGFRSLLCGDCTCNITVIARRTCFERVGLFDQSLRTSGDWDMWLRVARYYPFAYVDQVVARYRWHPGNITGTDSPDFAATTTDRAKVLDKIFDVPDLPHTIEATRPLAYRNLYLNECLRWLAGGRYKAGLGALGRAVRVSGRPASTLFRFGWLILRWRVFNRYPWGQACLKKMAPFARRWRERSA